MGRSLRLLEKFVSEKLQTITERFVCGFRLLAAQKPVNRPDWWKGKFALFQMPATSGGRVMDICPKANSPHLRQAGGESFYRQE